MRVSDGHFYSVVVLFMLLFVLSAPSLAKAQLVELAYAKAGVSSEESNRQLFRQMELEGINLQQPMLYGYFFYDKDSSDLRSLATSLLQDGYRMVRLDPASDTEYILHLERTEQHSLESLNKRMQVLEQLATKHRVRVCDGWDVGDPDPRKPVQSQEAYDAAIKRLSTAELYELAGYTYFNGNFKKAAPLYEELIAQGYRLDTCYYRLGKCMVEQDEFVKGIALFEQSIALDPKNMKAYFNIAATCYDNMQFEKSVQYYQKARALEPTNDAIYYGIAAGQFVLGQYGEAKINCEQAQRLNPKNENARNLLLRIPN